MLAEPVGIETARLSLRPLSMRDLHAVHGLWTEADVRKYLWDDAVISVGEARKYIIGSAENFERHGFGLWGIRAKERETLVGFCGLRFLDDSSDIEILYGFSPAHRGEGFATEAARAVIRHGFEEARLRRILGITDLPNVASARVLEKVGMVLLGHALYQGREELHYEITYETFNPTDEPYSLR
ncbi:MAG: GNAT family N-acetyltransferase [Rubrobacteraceae bacterium]